MEHHALLRAAPRTFAYAWNDSPIGLLAWRMRRLAEPDNSTVHWPQGSPGHFVAMEVPQTHPADIRAFFRKLR